MTDVGGKGEGFLQDDSKTFDTMESVDLTVDTTKGWACRQDVRTGGGREFLGFCRIIQLCVICITNELHTKIVDDISKRKRRNYKGPSTVP